MIDRTGQWWILTHEKLYRFAPVKDFAELDGKSPTKTYDRRDGLKSDGMFQIFEDSKGDIWVSVRGNTDDERGLARWNRAEDRFHSFSESEGFPKLKSPSAFAEDKAGNLWIGFYDGGGVVRYKNGRFEEFSEEAGLPPAIVTDLHLDRAGRLWLSSGSGGMRRVDDPGAEHPHFVSLTTDNGLSSNNVRTITEDNFGDIYAGTVRGVDRISPGAERIKHYSINDGLASDFVVDSRRDPAGTLWFATTSGLSRFVPSTEQARSTPPIWLGSLRVAGVEQPISVLGSVNLGALELMHTQNNLQIEFFGMDFSAGETLRYQFMLEGADSGWATATEQRTVSYANLQPGTYRFLVRAVNSDGVMSERPAVVSFTILPPIWLRWWFLTLVVLLVLTLFYLLYRYRLARLREVNAALAEAKRAEEDLGKAREDRLTELERVRTRIATDLHDDIGASLTQIAILSEVAQQRSQGNGASLEPLKSIANVSNELVETMSDIVWAINPRKDHLQDLIQRMRRFASDILSARGIGLQLDAPTFAPEIPLGANARREVFLIFKESLNNIVKHSGATQVRIEVEFSADSLTLKIVDNGQGFDPANVSAALFAGQKGGHGIVNMKERAAEMNGRLDIDASAGKGTVVTFQLPLDAVARHSRQGVG
jgi:signal transduction histidine kinase